MKQDRVHVRTCAACRTSGDKRSLLRIVKESSGNVAVDPTGKTAGRGAYLCKDPRCLQRALKEKRLSRALRGDVPEEIVRELERIMNQGLNEM